MRHSILHSFEQAIQLIQRILEDLHNPSIAFVGLRAADRNIFPKEVPFSLVVSLDYGQEAECIDFDIPIVSLEREKGFRRDWDMCEVEELLSSPFACKFIFEHLPEGSFLLPYASTFALENFADAGKYKVLNNKESLRSYFENKVTVTHIKQEMGLPNVSAVVDVFFLYFIDLKSTFGLPFVIQTQEGSSGSGTFIVENEDQFTHLLVQLGAYEAQVVVAPFIEGPSLSVSGIITQSQSIFLPPAIQIAHNPETSKNRFSFSGVDFASAHLLSDLDSSLLRSHLEKIGSYLRSKGYLGAVNFDFMANGLFLTDINPRFMGSGHLITEMQIRNNEIPFGLLHLLCHLGVDFQVSEEMVCKIWGLKAGSLIVMHSLEDERKAVRGSVSTNRYVFYKDKRFMEFASEENVLSPHAECFSISSSLSQVGKVVEPDAPVARIHTSGAVLERGTPFLSLVYKDICRQIYQNLRLA